MFESLRSRSKSLTLNNYPLKQSITTTERVLATPAPSTAKPPPPLGLFVLHPQDKAAQQELHVDVVAIHGLGGHAYTTWRHESGHLWLRDSLPSHVPGARIMTFSYDSAAAWCKPTSGIEAAALELLKQLRAARRGPKEQDRKIIFICHSLGGVVLKRALLCAKQKKQYATLLSKISSVLFMGTPHRESHTVTTVRILRDIVNCARLDSEVRLDFIDKTEEAAKVFKEVSKESLECLRGLEAVVSVYEQEELEPWEKLIVEPYSAILGIEDVPQEKVVPIAANHRTMVKLSPKEESRYLPIRTAIIELVSGNTNSTTSLKDQSDHQPTNNTTISDCASITTPTSPSAHSHHRSEPSRPPPTILSADSRGMPDTNRSMARLIESRIRNYAATRPDAGVRAHGAAYHARRAQQHRQEAREMEFARRQESVPDLSVGSIDAWRTSVRGEGHGHRDNSEMLGDGMRSLGSDQDNGMPVQHARGDVPMLSDGDMSTSEYKELPHNAHASTLPITDDDSDRLSMASWGRFSAIARTKGG